MPESFLKQENGTDVWPSRKDNFFFLYAICNCPYVRHIKVLTSCSLLLVSFLMAENLFYIRTNHISKVWNLEIISVPTATFWRIYLNRPKNLKNLNLFIQRIFVVFLLCARYLFMYWEYSNKWDKGSGTKILFLVDFS